MGKLEAGDVIFVRGKSIVSKVVRLFDKGEFSHVCIAVSPTHVVEAEWSTKSVITPFKAEDYEVIKLNLTDEQKYVLVKQAIQLTGRWYDYPQLLNYIFKGAKFGSPKYFICSEITYLLLAKVGYDLGNRDISPNELYDTLNDRLSVTI